MPEDQQIDPTRAEDYSILAWVLANKVKSEKAEELRFEDRLFLLDILTDWSREQVWKKCSQVGGSVIYNVKCFFALLKFGWGIIYTMPTDLDVEKFVKTKTNPMLMANPSLFKGIDTDSVHLKRINNRPLFFKGTVSKTAAISDTADLLVHDEVSRSDQQVVETYKSRTKASKIKARWMFSNPTTEKDVLDERWKKSDMKEWHIMCPNAECGLEQTVNWPASVCMERKVYQCQFCKTELSNDNRRNGRWIDKDGRVWDGTLNPNYRISGWHTSHLIAPWIDAEEVIEDSEGDAEYFYNFVLGEPYNPGDLSVSRATILDLWTPKELVTQNYYLGVDVGNVKHYVLGSEKGIIKVGRFTKWSDLDDIMRMYKPLLVIDAMPDNTMSRYYVDTYEQARMSFFQDNTNNPQVILWWGEGDKKGIVYSNRNRILDQLINDMLNAKFLIGCASDKELKEYVKHWETLRRVKVVNNKGIESYEWDSTTGVDHYVFATLYYRLAVLSIGAGSHLQPGAEEKYDFFAGGNVGDFGEMFDRAQQ